MRLHLRVSRFGTYRMTILKAFDKPWDRRLVPCFHLEAISADPLGEPSCIPLQILPPLWIYIVFCFNSLFASLEILEFSSFFQLIPVELQDSPNHLICVCVMSDNVGHATDSPLLVAGVQEQGHSSRGRCSARQVLHPQWKPRTGQAIRQSTWELAHCVGFRAFWRVWARPRGMCAFLQALHCTPSSRSFGPTPLQPPPPAAAVRWTRRWSRLQPDCNNSTRSLCCVHSDLFSGIIWKNANDGQCR